MTSFYTVQEVLDGKRKHQRTKMEVDDRLPLRGFLLCPKFGKVLTGSASTGCRNKYYYYYCLSSCGCRFNVVKANELFVDELRKYVPRIEMIEVYKIILSREYKVQSKSKYENHKQLIERINQLNIILSKAKNLLISETIDAADYRLIKTETEDEIRRLEAKLSHDSVKHSDFDNMLENALNTFSHLDCLYLKSSMLHKREIISSIFPDKLVFDGINYRTTRINEAVQLIYNLDKGFRENKREQISHFPEMFPNVTPQRLELWTH